MKGARNSFLSKLVSRLCLQKGSLGVKYRPPVQSTSERETSQTFSYSPPYNTSNRSGQVQRNFIQELQPLAVIATKETVIELNHLFFEVTSLSIIGLYLQWIESILGNINSKSYHQVLKKTKKLQNIWENKDKELRFHISTGSPLIVNSKYSSCLMSRSRNSVYHEQHCHQTCLRLSESH